MNEEQIFAGAVEIVDPEARQQYLEQACGGDADLRASVESLLAADREAGSFLGTPPVMESSTSSVCDVSAATFRSDASGYENEETQSTYRYLTPSTVPGSLGRLGHYDIQRVLGRGAFGTVFKAFDDRLERVVAIKVMSTELAATSPARKRFLREARASAAVRHENVVGIYAVEEQPVPYLVMEYIPGGTLHDALQGNGPFEISEVVRLGRQIAAGLAAAHAQGLVHRDIKPGNLLLEEGVETRIKITDFGLARAVDDASMTQSGVVAGTPMYMAPEQAQGQTIDTRADLFSLGSVLYALCTGRPPFRAPSTLAVLKRVVEDAPRPIPEIVPEAPADFCDLVNRLHAKRPDDRIQTAQEVDRRLGQIRFDVRASAAAPSARPATVSSTSGSSHAGRWLLGSAATVVLLAAALFWPRGGTPPQPEIRVSAAVGSNSASSPATPTPVEDPPVAAAPLLVERYRELWPEKAAAAGEPIAPGSLVPNPAAIDGVQSWTLETISHRDQIAACRISPQGNLIATGSFDGTVRLWDAAKPGLAGVLLAHEVSVHSIDWSKDGSVLLSAGGTEIAIWDVARRRLLRKLMTRSEPWAKTQPHFAVWGPQEDVVISWRLGVENAELCWWDLRTGKQFRTLEYPQMIYWSRGPVLARSSDARRIAIAAGRMPIRLLDADSGRELLSLNPTEDYQAIALSPDGMRLAAGDDHGRITVWNAQDGSVTATLASDTPLSPCIDLRFSGNGSQLFALHEQTASPVIWDISAARRLPDVNTFQVAPTALDCLESSGLLVTTDAGSSNMLVLTELASGRSRATISGQAQRRLVGFDWRSVDQKLVFARNDFRGGDPDLVFVNLSESPQSERVPVPTDMWTISWSNDGQRLANFFGQVWNISEKRLENDRHFQRELYGGHPTRKAWAPETSSLALAKLTKVPEVWDLEIHEYPGDKIARTFPAYALRGGMAFSPDGQELAFVGSPVQAEGLGELQLCVASLATGEVVRSVRLPQEFPNCVAWSPDGRRIAVSWVWGIFLYDSATLEHGKHLAFDHGGAGGTDQVVWLDSDHLAAPVRAGLIRVWHRDEGASADGEVRAAWTITENADGGRRMLAQSADGRYIAVWAPHREQRVTIWDWRERRKVLTVQLVGDAEQPLPLAIAPDGQYRFLSEVDKSDDLIVVYQTDAERSWLPLAEFQKRFQWKNDPEKVRLPQP
jgi:serine/threonine protein kinase/WD40 repeat protein